MNRISTDTIIQQRINNSNLEGKEIQGFHDNFPSIEVVRLPKRVDVKFFK
jgi:hypothetical protein